ncbi:MAG: BamA/TamA family outer membrane protein [Dysgonamonadaceae bacterium]|jgi:outer membrane translocation and assembly module TamA|nr:BamA/TamA family outer membrane protein [Dysgonamonadaceae bacterium]
MNGMKKYIPMLILSLFVTACDVTKRVPDGSYLLNTSTIETDRKGISKSAMETFVRQKPNNAWAVLGRVRLGFYSAAPNDSTWYYRLMRRWGEAPVIYNERRTDISAQQIELQLKNLGYLNAKVDTMVVLKNKKADVTYKIAGKEPYHIRNYRDTIQSADTTIYKILQEGRNLRFIKENDIFNLEVLENARTNMAQTLRNRGYYNMTKDYFYFLADTTVGTHQVDLTLGITNPADSIGSHQQYYMGKVSITNGVSPYAFQNNTRRNNNKLDTVVFNGMQIISGENRFMRKRALYYNTFLRPGRLYSDRLLERTYSSLNGLGSVSQTTINLTPTLRNDSNFVDADISIMPGRLHYLQFGFDGTHSAGDLGVAANTTYEHRNFFKGGERFRVKLNGAYEYVPKPDGENTIDHSYYEYGVETSLSIPQLLLPWLLKQLKDQPSASTEFSAGINFQKRPAYLRQFFNLSSQMQWTRMNWQLMNTLKPLDITFVRMPWKSEEFANQYLNENNPILRLSYDEQLIAATSYSSTYTNSSFRNAPRNPFNIRTGVEVAGLIPRIVSALGGGTTNSSKGYQQILGIRYAEYLKADFDFAQKYPVSEKGTLATHFAIGVLTPYRNSIVAPFEKRYYGGGANSVRGWSTRSLGPGTYNSDSTSSYFAYTVGDIRLDMSVEYRHKITSLFELAGFIDAGNIWTIRNYQDQQGGLFQLNQFYKQLAAAYGVGLRVDLTFLILRLDGGMKAHNPVLPAGERWTIFKPDLKRDFAIHFAIGYPF